MAHDYPTIADSVADALDLAPIEVSDLLNMAPFVARLPSTESSNGTEHKYSKETQAPVVGFRVENDGREYSHGVDEIVTVTLSILDWSSKTDKAVADAWRQGGREAYVRRNSQRHLRAALYKYEEQVINGTVGGDATGFQGMADTLSSLSDGMVVDAGGSAAGTGSSVYAVRMGLDHVTGVIKGDGVAYVDDVLTVPGDGATTGELPMYYQPACTWLALQVGSAYSFGRIANLTEEPAAQLNDDMLASLYAEFPAGYTPNIFIMSRRSLRQLQNSRTTYSPTGQPAPFPDSAHGVPILTVESISNAETLLV